MALHAAAGISRLAPEPIGTEDQSLNLKTLEQRTIERALTATGGHRAKAAQLLGISDRTLRYKLNGSAAAC